MSVTNLLDAVFDADRKLREAEQKLINGADQDELSKAIERATDAALSHRDEEEAAARLIRLSDLCAQVQGTRMAETLIRILNHDDPQVRLAAGEALRDFAYDRYAEVARAVEKAFERDKSGPALEELPWILAEIAEPSALPLIARCLEHPRAEVVAAGIEALSELNDPEAIPMLARLVDDARLVSMEEGDVSYSTTLGELAREAISELEGDA